jgi:hypothetical protein
MGDVIHAFSFGGGVQSTAALVLAAEGKLPATDESFRWDVFLFANVGENAEHPATLKYVEEYAMPFAEANGIELRELRKVRRDGSPRDLWDDMHSDRSSIGIPVRMSNGAPGNRRCTVDYKIKVIGKELRRLGACKDEGQQAILGIGISMDEMQRAKHWGVVNPQEPYQIKEYPLLRLGLRRRDCLQIIRDSGLPQPPRSACFFCPFHSLDEWRRLKREDPDLFARSVALEKKLNETRARLGKDSVWLTRYSRPLDEVVDDQLVLGLDDPGNADAPCDSGHCFI